MSQDSLNINPSLYNVELMDVTLRDGLQSLPAVQILPFTLEFRQHMLRSVYAAGVRRFEVGAYVRADLVPAMAMTRDFLKSLKKETWSAGAPRFSALIPNLKGFEQALEDGIDEIAVLTAVSDTFNQKNIGTNVRGSFVRLQPVVAAAQKKNLPVRAYVSTSFHCPYEGTVMPEKVVPLVLELRDLGIQDIVLSDTTGRATPLQVRMLLKKIFSAGCPENLFSIHLHDTYGFALANLDAALQMGIRRVDASVAGIGGCPYAPGASGNVAMNDVIFFLEEQGITTGVDFKTIQAMTTEIEKVGVPVSSRVYRAML